MYRVYAMNADVQNYFVFNLRKIYEPEERFDVSKRIKALLNLVHYNSSEAIPLDFREALTFELGNLRLLQNYIYSYIIKGNISLTYIFNA